MTVELYYLDNGRGTILNASNHVTGKQFITILDSLYKQHQVTPQHYRIIDMSWCSEYDITAEDIKTISKIDERFARINPDLMVAIIEPKTLEFTLTDVWKAYVEDFLKNIKKFDNQEQAMQWIKDHLFKQNTLITE